MGIIAKRESLGLALLLVLATPVVAAAAEESARVVVLGSAEIRVAPDRAYLTLAVESVDPNPRAAQQQNAKISDAVLEALRAAGLAENAIRTLAYNLREEFDYDKGRRLPRGYRASNQVEVRLDDVDEVGRIIDLATGAGATSVAGLRFDVKDRDRLEREALGLAVADGKARAEAAAAGAGAKIGRLLEIEQAGAGAPPPPGPVFRGRMEMAASDAPAPPIEAGEITLSASVRITAALD